MLETLFSIILLPFAAVALVFTVAFGVGAVIGLAKVLKKGE